MSQLSDHDFSLFGRRSLFEMNLFGSAVAHRLMLRVCVTRNDQLALQAR